MNEYIKKYNEEIISNFKLTFTQGNKNYPNKTSNYVLPMLGNTVGEFKSNELFPQCQFRSAFLGDNTHDIYKNDKILLCYKFSGKQEYINFENTLRDNFYYVDEYEVDKMHTMYVFDVPKTYIDDYLKFLEWKPSKFSNSYKIQIQKFYNLSEKHPLYQTLYKKEERYKELEKQYDITIPRDLEASSSPHWDIEYYNEEFKVVKPMEKLLENGRREFE